MNHFKQVLTVTLWEYKRFYKLKNELLGIVIMLFMFFLSYFGGRYAASGSPDKKALSVVENSDPKLLEMLSGKFIVETIPAAESQTFISDLSNKGTGVLLVTNGNGFEIHAWKKPAMRKELKEILNNYSKNRLMEKNGWTPEQLQTVMQPSVVKEVYLHETGIKGRIILAFVFAGLMIMAVFLSFAYQFTAITGEKQLKITEQIISAIKPQVWMDGKILGITLTGVSSMLTYSIIGSLGSMLFLQFTGKPIANILQYLHVPTILLFLPFTLTGIMIWNAMLAAVASMITDPNNSGKSSLMLLPVLFVAASFLVMKDPDSGLSVFLSWFPLTSATAMPMRWVATEIHGWQLAGSFIILAGTFYFLRRLAAKIFRVSILISGQEPSIREIIRMARK